MTTLLLLLILNYNEPNIQGEYRKLSYPNVLHVQLEDMTIKKNGKFRTEYWGSSINANKTVSGSWKLIEGKVHIFPKKVMEQKHRKNNFKKYSSNCKNGESEESKYFCSSKIYEFKNDTLFHNGEPWFVKK